MQDTGESLELQQSLYGANETPGDLIFPYLDKSDINLLFL